MSKGGDDKKFKLEKFHASTTDPATCALARLQYITEMSFDDMMGFLMCVLLHIFAQCTAWTMVLLFRSSVVQKSLVPFEHVVNMTAELDMKLENPLYASPILTKSLGMCATNDSHPQLHYMMLFLWLAQSTPDLFGNIWRIFIVCMVPSDGEDEDDEPAEEEITEKGHALSHISIPLKIFIMIFVIVPHAGCVLYTTWVGAKFIAVEGDVATILMKALILKFIVTLDNIIWDKFATNNMKKYFASPNSGFKILKEKPNGWNMMWDKWGGSVVKTLGCFVLAVLYYRVAWKDVMHFRNLCHQHLEGENYAMHCPFKSIPGHTCGMTSMKMYR